MKVPSAPSQDIQPQACGLQCTLGFCLLSSMIGNRQLTVRPRSLVQQPQQQSVKTSAQKAGEPQRPHNRQVQYPRVLETQQIVKHRVHQGAQQTSQMQQPTWGYLTGTDADQWTWDDDYNPGAKARAAAEAQQLPPTPRQQALSQQEAVAAQQRPTVMTRLPQHFNSKVLANGVLLIDKPPRWTSADVVRQLRNVLKVKKIGVGGPLDAHATGLIIVLLGAATRLTPKLEPLERVYTGTLKLGVTTTTYDSTGQTVQINPWQHISDDEIQAAAAKFQGEVMQVPCMWSSTKFKNRPLRWYAERGETILREPKAVHISSIDLWRDKEPTGDGCMLTAATVSIKSSSGNGFQAGQPDSVRGGSIGAYGVDTVNFRVVASKGASMRVLAHDIGEGLGCGAHLLSLRREGIGGFSVDTAWSLDVLLPLAKKYGKGFRSAA